MNHEQLIIQCKKISQEIDLIHSQLASLPDGDFFCSRNGKNSKWYHTNGKIQTYIPKSNRHFAEQLALKKYLTLRLRELCQKKNALEYYLKHVSFPQKSDLLLENSAAYQDLLRPFFTPLSQELQEWISTPYEHCPRHPEHLIHKTISGNLVRSKSEALIDMVLYTHKIPFRYECALQLGDITIYPDFTIRHPRTGIIYYWEHFGLMDDPVYCKSACSKLQLYITNGIIPTIQLITTYETANVPLSSSEIEKIVEHYFL